MKRITYLLFCIFFVGTETKCSIPAAIPIHGLTFSTGIALATVISKKNSAYNEMRKILLNQAKRDHDAHRSDEIEKNLNLIEYISNLPKERLLGLAYNTVATREEREEAFGNIAISEAIGFDENEQEKKTTESLKTLILSINSSAKLEQQLRAALIGTGLASVFTALRQLNLLS